MAVTIDESPDTTNEPELMVCIKIDDEIIVKCTAHWIDQLTNEYTTLQIDAFETNLIDHVEGMGFTITPQLETDIKDAIAYVGTLG